METRSVFSFTSKRYPQLKQALLIASTMINFQRTCLVGIGCLTAWLSAHASLFGAEPVKLRLKDQSVSFPQPHADKAVYEMTAYASPRGPEMIRLRTEEIKNDITTNYELSFSGDHGESFSGSVTLESSRQTPEGMFRAMFFFPPFCDPQNGRLLMVGEEGVLPADSAHDAFTNLYTAYRTSTDQGRTWSPARRVIQQGAEYSAEHPLATVYVGKNASQTAGVIYGREDGAVIVPLQLSILQEGMLYLPPGASTYLDSAMLIGRWQADGSIEWDLGGRIHLPPEKSLRGVFEPTIVEFPGGRMLAVMRANDGHKWYAVSRDGGLTWGDVKPWTYADGSPFFSPSSFSQLVKHSDGTRYWFGNITPEMPKGNNPRYPLVVGRVDPETLLLEKDSVLVIDDRKAGDSTLLQLSNFNLVEDRRSGDFLLRMPRRDDGQKPALPASVHLYRVGR
jgi:hypothetical protein